MIALFNCEQLICYILTSGSENVAATEPVSGCPIPDTPTEDTIDVSNSWFLLYVSVALVVHLGSV